MWFCDAEHIIAVVITDHWACFKEVPGEQFAHLLKQFTLGKQTGSVCRKWYTLSTVFIATQIELYFRFQQKIIFTIILKKWGESVVRSVSPAQMSFWKRTHLFRLAIPPLHAQALQSVNPNNFLQRKGSLKHESFQSKSSVIPGRNCGHCWVRKSHLNISTSGHTLSTPWAAVCPVIRQT